MSVFKALTPHGTAKISTDQYKFGRSSGLFNYTSAYLTTVDHNDFNFGTGDFTIDFWFRLTDDAKNQVFYMQQDDANNVISILYSISDTRMYFTSKSGGTNMAYYSNSHVLAANTWYHYEVGRNGSNFYMFKDGMSLTLTVTTAIGTNSLPDLSAIVYIGTIYGYMDELRLSKGVCRHTNDFTVETSEYVYDSYTKLLIHFNGINNAVAFADNAFDQIITHEVYVRLLTYIETKTAEAGTTTTNVKITGHGLSDNNFIVNTTRRSDEQNATERGSRRISVVDDDNLTCEAITSQTTGDDIRLYSYVDISSYIDLHSLNLELVSEETNTLTFTMQIPSNSVTGMDIIPTEGQYIKFSVDDTAWYVGIISNTSRTLSNNSDNVTMTVTSISLKSRCYTRTVGVNYASGVSSKTIFDDMITYLIQEGFETGYVSTGITISEAWVNDVISIGEILDELAEKNGYQWFVGNNYKLYFYKDTSFVAWRDIIQDGTFTDFRDVVINSNIADYRNKIFFVGGNDVSGCVLYNFRGDYIAQDYIQAITAGSGVYGDVIRNSSITNRWSYTAGAGTTTTNVNITGHIFSVGDYFKNRTRNLFGYVTAYIDANNFTCTSVAGQTSGDLISCYWDASKITKNELRQKKNNPTEITFHSFDMTFYPQQCIYIEIPLLNISASYWNVERVVITDAGRGYLNQVVTCVLADENDFCSQRKKNQDIDFFKQY